MPYLTYSFRIKDSSKSLVKELVKKSQSVNDVWNFCNETQISALRKGKLPWEGPDKFKLMELTAGSSKELGLQSSTVQALCEEYDSRRRKVKKAKLNWRSRKRNLPWIPFKASAIRVDRKAATARYLGIEFSFWKSREIPDSIKTGSICSDNRGRWYINLTCEVSEIFGPNKESQVGIDLGLKEVFTLSNGRKEQAPQFYRRHEKRLAKAQRANKAKQVKKINKKISNSRKDFNHKISTEIVKEFGTIKVGNVNSTDIIAKPKMAKSVYDASWYQLKTFIKYKALARGSIYKEVDEKYSTQKCSECGCIPNSSPKGIKGLSVREWTCAICHTKHDRDINAAKNILRFGRESPSKQSSKRV